MQRGIFKIANIALLLIFGSAAHADTWRQWSDEVDKAAKGLKICADTYFDATGYASGSKQRKKVVNEAARTCGTLKEIFNITMITVRSNVDGMDDELKEYHKLVMDSFDQLVPQPGDSPLDYLSKTSKIDLAVAKMRHSLALRSIGR